MIDLGEQYICFCINHWSIFSNSWQVTGTSIMLCYTIIRLFKNVSTYINVVTVTNILFIELLL